MVRKREREEEKGKAFRRVVASLGVVSDKGGGPRWEEELVVLNWSI